MNDDESVKGTSKVLADKVCGPKSGKGQPVEESSKTDAEKRVVVGEPKPYDLSRFVIVGFGT